MRGWMTDRVQPDSLSNGCDMTQTNSAVHGYGTCCVTHCGDGGAFHVTFVCGRREGKGERSPPVYPTNKLSWVGMST